MDEGSDRDAAIEKLKDEIAHEKQRVLEAGGLFVLGTERHESRRIDNQLRGRSGRQGDPGLSRFYLCLEDDLLRIFGPDTLFAKMMNKNLADGEAIGSKWLSKAIETAQKKVEARNYDIRKQVVEYDDVMNDQRKVIYEQRAEIMDGEDAADDIENMRLDTIASIVYDNCPEGSYPEQWNVDGLKEQVSSILALNPDIDEWMQEETLDQPIIEERLVALSAEAVKAKTGELDDSIWKDIQKSIMLQVLDHNWKEHLSTLDALRQVVFLRAYAQKTPLNEYKQEAFGMFERLLETIREEVTRTVHTSDYRLATPEMAELPELPEFLTTHIDPLTGEDDSNDIDAGSDGRIVSTLPPQQRVPESNPMGENPYSEMDISRNAPCPCGSGRKYKHCHGASR